MTSPEKAEALEVTIEQRQEVLTNIARRRAELEQQRADIEAELGRMAEIEAVHQAALVSTSKSL